MSSEIDIKSYAGEVQDSAAENQQPESNFLPNSNEDYPVYKEFLDESQQVAPVENQNIEETPSKQELNFKALRDEISKIKAEKDELAQNLQMLKSNSAQLQQPEEKKSIFKGMGKRDVPNVEEIEMALAERERGYRAQIEELQVMQKHSDYAEVLDKLAPLLKEKPHLIEGIQGASNKALFAYELGKLAQNAMQAQQINQPPTPINNNAQRIVENSRKPGTLSQTGGQSALSQADYYASMSDKEFMDLAMKNLNAI